MAIHGWALQWLPEWTQIPTKCMRGRRNPQCATYMEMARQHTHLRRTKIRLLSITNLPIRAVHTISERVVVKVQRVTARLIDTATALQAGARAVRLDHWESQVRVEENPAALSRIDVWRLCILDVSGLANLLSPNRARAGVLFLAFLMTSSELFSRGIGHWSSESFWTGSVQVWPLIFVFEAFFVCHLHLCTTV